MSDDLIRDTYQNPLFCRLCGVALTAANHCGLGTVGKGFYHGLCASCMARYRVQMEERRNMQGFVEIGKAPDGSAIYKRVTS